MAVTLDDIKVNLHDDTQKGVIDEFIKGDYIFKNIPFEFIANPITGGAGWTASYTYVKEESKTGFRDINGKYTDSEAKQEVKNAEVKVYGGSFTVDRALRDQGGVENIVSFQMKQKIKALRKGFSYELINGQKATDSKSFDGLDTLLKHASTEVDLTEFDLSTFAKVKENALEFASKLNDFLSLLTDKPDALFGNSILINKLKLIAKILGLGTETQSQAGNFVGTWNGGIPLVELGVYDNKETIPIDGGKTSLYAVKFGEDGLEVLSPDGGKAIDVILPDFTQATEQARGLVELRGVPVIRNSKSCGVLRNIKVQ